MFATLLLFSLALRIANFGDWNFEVDDQWYALVGHRLLAGDTLYTDIFDRKGPALFLTYSALAVFGSSVVPFQIAATLCAALTAFGTAQIAARIADARSGLAAGLVLAAMMVVHGGANGQTPVFYNPLMLVCAWAVITRIDLLSRGEIDRRVLAGFGAAGLAIAFKMSAVFEGVYFGLFALTVMLRSHGPSPRVFLNAAMLALMGAGPMLATAAWYLLTGHFADLWQALVLSNFERTYFSDIERLQRTKLFLTLIWLPLTLAAGSMALLWMRAEFDAKARLVLGWVVAAVFAVLVFPAFYVHYILPALPPLCIAMAPIVRRSRAVTMVALGFAALAVWNSDQVDPASRTQSRAESARLVSYLATELPNRRLLVWGSPSYLYELTGSRPPSVLAFPPHLFHMLEAGASGRDEVDETRKILANRPDAVVIQSPLTTPVNVAADDMVRSYVQTCGKVRRFTMRDHFGPQAHTVYSRCGTDRARR